MSLEPPFSCWSGWGLALGAGALLTGPSDTLPALLTGLPAAACAFAGGSETGARRAGPPGATTRRRESIMFLAKIQKSPFVAFKVVTAKVDRRARLGMARLTKQS